METTKTDAQPGAIRAALRSLRAYVVLDSETKYPEERKMQCEAAEAELAQMQEIADKRFADIQETTALLCAATDRAVKAEAELAKVEKALEAGKIADRLTERLSQWPVGAAISMSALMHDSAQTIGEVVAAYRATRVQP